MARPLFLPGRIPIGNYKHLLRKESGPVQKLKNKSGHPSLVVLNWKQVTVSASIGKDGVCVSTHVMNGDGRWFWTAQTIY